MAAWFRCNDAREKAAPVIAGAAFHLWRLKEEADSSASLRNDNKKDAE
jgi:hypothetical protein